MKKASSEIMDQIRMYERGRPYDAFLRFSEIATKIGADPLDIKDAKRRFEIYVTNLAYSDVCYSDLRYGGGENQYLLRLFYDLYRTIDIKVSQMKDREMGFDVFDFDEFLQEFRRKRKVYEVMKKVGLLRSDIGLSAPSSPLAHVKVIKMFLENCDESEFDILRKYAFDGKLGDVVEKYRDDLLLLLSEGESEKLKKLI